MLYGLDASALRQSLEDLVTAHDALRTTFDPAGDLLRADPALHAPLLEQGGPQRAGGALGDQGEDVRSAERGEAALVGRVHVRVARVE